MGFAKSRGSHPAINCKNIEERWGRKVIDLEAAFSKYAEEKHHFEAVKNSLSDRPDLHAFLLLDRLVPCPAANMIGSTDKDVIYLEVDCVALAEAATEEDILTLVRCGISYNATYGWLEIEY